MFCTACATTNLIGASRCRVCGSGLAGPGANRPTGGREGADARRPVRQALYAAALVAVVVVIAGATGAVRDGPNRWYAQGEAAAAAGRYPEAIAAFAAAGDHADAAARRDALVARFAPHQAAYRDAAAARAAGDFDRAVELLRPVVRALPRYEEAALLLSEARTLRAAELTQAANAAEARRDWLAAERALAALVALAPADGPAAERLAALRRDHAPLVLGRDRALWLVGPDGTDDRLLFDQLPAAWPTWSPDRRQLAFTAAMDDGDIALVVLDLERGSWRRVAGGLRPYAGPAWSPDGGRIAYAAGGSGGPFGAAAEAGIRVVDLATGRVSDVTGGRVRNAIYPSWSPDGERLAFVSRVEETGGYTVAPAAGNPGRRPADAVPTGELYAATLATGELTNLSQGRIPHPWRAAWSPADTGQGEAILVYTREPGMSYDRDRARLALLDPVNGGLTDLPTAGERVTMPVWSPDGRRLAYVAGEDTLVARTIGGGARRFTVDSSLSRFVAWAPDGRTLLAVAEGMGGPSYVVPLDEPPADPAGDDPPVAPEPEPVRLAYDADRRQSGSPQWSPVHLAPAAAPMAVAGTGLDRADEADR